MLGPDCAQSATTGARLPGTAENRYNPPQVWESSRECRLITLSDARIAIYGASELDNALELILLGKMRSLGRNLKDQLFDGYGPLSTFSKMPQKDNEGTK